MGQRQLGVLTRMGSPALRVSRLRALPRLDPQPDAGAGARARCCAAAGRARFPASITAGAAASSGFGSRTIGAPTGERPVLFASNHISYLDITVLGSLIPGSFIAKAEVAGWPLFGWLAKLQRSVFVDRQVRSTRQQRDAITERLAARRRADPVSRRNQRRRQSRAAVQERPVQRRSKACKRSSAIAVQPVSIAYTRLDGIPLGRLLRPVLRLVRRRPIWRRICGTCSASAPSRWWSSFIRRVSVADFASRKALARYCHARVAGGMAAAIAGRPQPVPEPPRRRLRGRDPQLPGRRRRPE